MRQTLLLFFSFFLLKVSPVLAQAFEPGLVVRTNGDTLRGKVENGFWLAPPEFIRFRPTPASPPKLLQPRQLRTVSFTGGRYFRYEVVPINRAAETRFSDLPYGNYVSISQDALLAEVLLTGPIELRRILLPGAAHYMLRREDRSSLTYADPVLLPNTTLGWRQRRFTATLDG